MIASTLTVVVRFLFSIFFGMQKLNRNFNHNLLSVDEETRFSKLHDTRLIISVSCTEICVGVFLMMHMLLILHKKKL